MLFRSNITENYEDNGEGIQQLTSFLEVQEYGWLPKVTEFNNTGPAKFNTNGKAYI